MQQVTLGVAIVGAVLSSAADAAVPNPIGLVNDFANVIDDRREADIDALVRDVARTTSAEIAVVTVPSLEGKSIEQYAHQLFNAWGIGKKGTNNGVLVLVAPSSRTMRIEVGYGLEAVLPDGLAGEIIRSTFVPRFRDGDYTTGILDGVTRIAAIVREGRRAAPNVIVERGIEPAGDDAGNGDDTPPAWLLVPFLGLFVTSGAFATGVSVRARTLVLLIVGVMFSVMPFIILLVSYPALTLLTVAPVAALLASIGYVKGGTRKWREILRGTAAADGTDWTTRSSSDSSSDSSSSSSDFGGGSSGGGGASGHW